jgi:hypothetical protein
MIDDNDWVITLVKMMMSMIMISIFSRLWCEHFLSTTVQLPATQRKVEGEERDIHLINVNEANSCLAQGYYVHYSPRKESGAYRAPPPTHALPIAEFGQFSATSAKSEDGLHLGA